MPRQPLAIARTTATARTTAAVRAVATARTASSPVTTWKKLWFPCDESTASPKNKALWGPSITGTFASGEIIRGMTSGATGTLLKASVETQYYNPGGNRYNSEILIFTPLSGVFSSPENVVGQGSGAICPFDFGPRVVLTDDTGTTFFTEDSVGGPILLTNSGYVGPFIDSRPFYGVNPLTGINDNDFIFQIVTSPQVTAGAENVKLGYTGGATDFLRIKKDGVSLGTIGVTDAIIAGTTVTTGQNSQVMIRRKNHFMGFVDNAQRQVAWGAISAGNQNLNNFQNLAGIQSSTSAANSRIYGVVLALFAPAGLPAMDIVLAGCAYHKAQWLANNKVLYTGW